MASQETQVALEIIKSPRLERLYYSHSKSIKYVFGDKGIAGHVANFINHRYTTADPTKIAELDREINLGHPEFFWKEDEKEIDPRLQDPKLAMRVEILKDIALQELRATDPSNNMGSTENKPLLKPASTSDIAPVAAGGDASALKTRLANMLQQPTTGAVEKKV